MSRVAKIAVGLLGVAALACVDLASPKGEPASISQIQLPELFIVRGDQMRDTAGNPVPPSVITYDGAGNPVTGFSPSFFVTDTNPVVTINAAGLLTASATRVGTAHLIGQIGNVQTPATAIFVTAKPTILRSAVTGSDTLRLTIAADSAASIGTFALGVQVRSAGTAPADTGIGGAFVYYKLVSAPLASRTSALTTYLADEANNRTTVDTTDANGAASRRLVINSKFLADQDLVAGRKIDSVIVEARMKYRGVDLTNSPLRFVIKVKGGFGT